MTPLPPFNDRARKAKAGMLERRIIISAPIIVVIDMALKMQALFVKWRSEGQVHRARHASA